MIFSANFSFWRVARSAPKLPDAPGSAPGKRYALRGPRYGVIECNRRSPWPALVGVVAMLGLQWMPGVFLMQQAQAQEAQRKALEPKPPEWYQQAQTRYAQIEAKRAQSVQGSKPGQVAASTPLDCEDCEVSVLPLDLSRVPTEKELRMAGQLGGALSPVGNAEVTELAAGIDGQLKAEGFEQGLGTRTRPGSAADTVLRAAKEKVERLQKINLDFGHAIQNWNKHQFRQAARQFEMHLEQFPDSPWAGEALLHLGCDAKYNGRFSEAQQRFSQLLEMMGEEAGQGQVKDTTKRHTRVAPRGDDESAAEALARRDEEKLEKGRFELSQKAKLRWADLDIALGRFEDASKKLANIIQTDNDWRRRTWARHWLRNVNGYQKADAKKRLAACGSQALSVMLAKLDKDEASKRVADLPAPREAGFSLAELQRISKQHGVEMVGFKAKDAAQLANLPTPFIVHYDFHEATKAAKKATATRSAKLRAQRAGKTMESGSPFQALPDAPGHYLVVQQVDALSKTVQLYDPLAKRLYHLDYAALQAEWSGKGLMLAKGEKQSGVQRLAMADLQQTFGGCCGVPSPEDDTGCCPNNDDGNGGCGEGDKAYPVWNVNRVTMNLYISDTPLWYKTPKGPDVEVKMSYNSQDSTTQFTPFGNKWMFNYGGYLVEDTGIGGGVVTVFMPDGGKDNYTPNGSGGYTSEAGNYNTLTKLGTDRWQIEFQGGDKAIYDIPSGTSSLQPFLVEIKDRWGYGLTFGYETVGTRIDLTTITDASSKVTRLWYDGNGRIVRVADPIDRHATFSYDTNGNMIEAVDMEGHAFQYTYDNDIRVTQLNTAQGPWQFYHEGPDGYFSPFYPAPGTAMWENLRLTITDPAGKKEEYYYDGYYGRSWHVDKNQYREYNQSPNNAGQPKTMWHYDYTQAGPQIYYTEYPDGTTEQKGFDYSTGLPTSTTDRRGKTSTMTFNAAGQPTSTTDAKNQTTTIAYASNGIDVASITNADSVMVSTFTYDSYHQPTSVTDADNNTTTTTYTAWGAPATVTDADGTTTYNYNSAGQLTSLTRGTSTLASFTYDGANRVASQTDAANVTVSYEYNNIDHVTKETYSDSTTVTYDYVCCGLPGVKTDRAGRKSYYDYDAMRRLVRMQDASGNAVQLDYDAEGNRTRLVDALGNLTQWQYNAANAPIKKIYHDASFEEYSYSGGVLSQKKNARGQVIGFAYDNNSNMTGIDYPDMTDVAISYNALDKPATMTDGLGTHTFGYDAMGRLLSVNGPWADDTVSYTYDDMGRRSTLGVQHGTGSDSVSYAYDALSRLDSLTSEAGTFDYSYVGATGLVDALAMPNGTVADYSYDAQSRLTQIQNLTSASANISRYEYGYDARQVRTSVESEIGTNPIKTTAFTYDTTDQLTKELTSEGSTGQEQRDYGYDAMGNRTAAASTNLVSQETSSTGYEKNRLNQYTATSSSGPNSTSAAAFVYDADGNLTQTNGSATSGQTTTLSRSDYSYDSANRLTSVVRYDTDGTTLLAKSEFIYDGINRQRVSKEYSRVNNAWQLNLEVRRVYDGMNVVQERDDQNDVTAFYTRGTDMGGGIGGLLSRSTSSGHFYYHYDGRGNVTQLTDSNQDAVAKYEYSAFGSTLYSVGAQAGQPYRFSTKEIHAASGMYDYGYRFYNAGMGRWLNQDPIEEAGGINLYGFVNNNGINNVDAYGLSWQHYAYAAILMTIVTGASLLLLGIAQQMVQNSAGVASTQAMMVARCGMGLIGGALTAITSYFGSRNECDPFDYAEFSKRVLFGALMGCVGNVFMGSGMARDFEFVKQTIGGLILGAAGGEFEEMLKPCPRD